MSGCSDKQEVQPTTQSTSLSVGVQVVDGRLVFANQKAFERNRDELAQMSQHQEAGQKIKQKEESLRFKSLRYSAQLENAQLEVLEATNQPTPAHDLMEEFGFPECYAALISPAGEYQIGSKIYWFHKGFK